MLILQKQLDIYLLFQVSLKIAAIISISTLITSMKNQINLLSDDVTFPWWPGKSVNPNFR